MQSSAKPFCGTSHAKAVPPFWLHPLGPLRLLLHWRFVALGVLLPHLPERDMSCGIQAAAARIAQTAPPVPGMAPRQARYSPCDCMRCQNDCELRRSRHEGFSGFEALARRRPADLEPQELALPGTWGIGGIRQQISKPQANWTPPRMLPPRLIPVKQMQTQNTARAACHSFCHFAL